MRFDLSGARRKVLTGGVGLALAAAALLVLNAHVAEAQGWAGRGGRGAWMGGPRAGASAGVLLPPLRRLDLSDEQRDQVRTVIGESREAARETFGEMRAAREALAEAVASATVDEERIRTLAADLGRLEGDAAVRQAQVYAAVWEILTPEQQAQAGQMQAARQERMQERRERIRERREERREQRNQ